MGYTDTIIDVRTARLQLTLGVDNTEQEENVNSSMNGTESNKRASESQGKVEKRMKFLSEHFIHKIYTKQMHLF
jgi:hypothetical protein